MTPLTLSSPGSRPGRIEGSGAAKSGFGGDNGSRDGIGHNKQTVRSILVFSGKTVPICADRCGSAGGSDRGRPPAGPASHAAGHVLGERITWNMQGGGAASGRRVLEQGFGTGAWNRGLEGA